MRKLSLAVFLLLFVTRAFGAGHELGPRGSSPSSYPVRDPQVAFAGDRFLTLWTENMGAMGVQLMGAFSDASGRRGAQVAFPVIPSYSGFSMQLIGLGDGYALFWKSPRDKTFLTEIALDGSVVRTTELALPPYFGFDAAWNGSRFLVGIRYFDAGGHTVEGILFSRTGELLQRGILFDNQAQTIDVAPDGDGFIAATTGPRDVFAYRITSAGALTAYPLHATPYVWSALVSTTAGGDLAVVWSANMELYAAFVTSDGEVVSRSTLASSAIPMFLAHLRRVGNAHLVTYADAGSPQSGLATLILHDSGVVTPAAELAAELPQNTATAVMAASSPTTTLALYTPGHLFPPQLLQVATANDATASAPAPVTLGRSRQSQPILAAHGGRVLAAWTDLQGPAAYVRTASLTPDATPLTDNIAAPALHVSRELAWNGSQFLTLASRDQQLLAVRLDANGAPIDTTVLAPHSFPWAQLHAAVTWAGDRWIIVWQNGGELHFASMRGGEAPFVKRLIGDAALSNSDPALSFNGSTLLLVWNQTDYSGCTFFPPCFPDDLPGVATKLTLDGQFLGSRVTIPRATDYSLATSGTDFFILGGTTATMIDGNVSRVVASRPVFNWAARGDVTWDGSSYAVALRYFGAVWHVSVTHFDRELNVAGAPRGTTTLPPDDFAAPSIAGGMVGVQEGDPVNGARAVAYLESELAPLPAPPPAPLNVRVGAIENGRYPITWDESPGAELYRVFVYGLASGVVIETYDVPATAERRVLAATGAARVIAFNAGGASDPLPRRRASRR